MLENLHVILIIGRVVNHWPRGTRKLGKCRKAGISEWEVPQVSLVLRIQSLKTLVLGKCNNDLSSRFLYLIRTQRIQKHSYLRANSK